MEMSPELDKLAPAFVLAGGPCWLRHPTEHHLSVDDDGMVFSALSGKVLRGCSAGDGYRAITVPSGKRIYLHAVVCETFHGPRPSARHQVRHLNGNKQINRPGNLAWGTCAENAADKIAHGTLTSGERNPMARLTNDKVSDMRRVRRETGASYAKIGRQFGVSTMTAFQSYHRKDLGMTAPQVYAAIAAVQGELAKTGIAKNRRNSQGSGYNFRGIDDVYAALSPLLAQHGLTIIPRMIEREVTERAARSGGALFYTTVKGEFDFVSVADGSKHTACTYGEAMDSGDKSTNKAMSAAYKYAAFLTFAIPTEGDNDADNSTYEIARDTVVISDAQYATLQTMLQASGADVKKFCERYKTPSVKELPASSYDHAYAALSNKLANMKDAA